MKDIEILRRNKVALEASLELFGDMATYDETLTEFQEALPNKVEQIKKYYEEKDMPNYAIYVHSLKSDCKYFGFTSLADLAYEHEKASKTGDTVYVNENYSLLLEEIEKVRKMVNQYLDSDPDKEQVKEKEMILVADDSEVIRMFVKKIVSDAYEVLFANDGEETLDIIKQHEEDCKLKALFLDLNMPKVDGFAVLEYMKENDLFDTIPVSIISGESSSEGINRAFKYPIIDMLNKPFNEQKIKDIIERTIKK